VGISDGDTLTARCGRAGAYERVRVRIAAIDAPEKAQPYGQRSKQALSSICFQEKALITEIDTDRYGRTVADVSCNGEDAGSRMVADGWAWVYDYNRLATSAAADSSSCRTAPGRGTWACGPTRSPRRRGNGARTIATSIRAGAASSESLRD
jgi:endonuclease YncB( thermonuclease family)